MGAWGHVVSEVAWRDKVWVDPLGVFHFFSLTYIMFTGVSGCQYREDRTGPPGNDDIILESWARFYALASLMHFAMDWSSQA